MDGWEYVDASRNQERIDVNTVIPNVGYTLINQFINFNTKILTQYIPSLDFCQKFYLPYDVNLN